jgi:hypothetical protein
LWRELIDAALPLLRAKRDEAARQAVETIVTQYDSTEKL